MAFRSKIVICPICRKQVHVRGLYGHKKLKDHLLVVNPVTHVVQPPSILSPVPSENEINEPESFEPNSSEGGPLREEETQVPGLIGLAGLEDDRKSFTPKFLDWKKSFLKNLEGSKREWEQLCELQRKYSWVIFFNRFKALKRMFG